tara:strand:+ start:588 stop:776 length:189 start_codon:yes stop_codon:yes gene_type:complete
MSLAYYRVVNLCHRAVGKFSPVALTMTRWKMQSKKKISPVKQPAELKALKCSRVILAGKVSL